MPVGESSHVADVGEDPCCDHGPEASRSIRVEPPASTIALSSLVSALVFSRPRPAR